MSIEKVINVALILLAIVASLTTLGWITHSIYGTSIGWTLLFVAFIVAVTVWIKIFIEMGRYELKLQREYREKRKKK